MLVILLKGKYKCNENNIPLYHYVSINIYRTNNGTKVVKILSKVIHKNVSQEELDFKQIISLK